MGQKMEKIITYRYPGPRPFIDDELSRQVFFGREEESTVLNNLILSHNLVTVYSRSGAGKSSLINAGIAPKLRRAGRCPLICRVNAEDVGPTASILSYVHANLTKSESEYNHGDSASLYKFFQEFEIWSNDLLIKPVLILDQFEEIFTLYSVEERRKFICSLGELVRGVNFKRTKRLSYLSIVLVLREDFLGNLEELSTVIPTILSHSYKIKPLSNDNAVKAIVEPAKFVDKRYDANPFKIEKDSLDNIVNYLSRVKTRSNIAAEPYIEPFQLQVISQKIEQHILATNKDTFVLKEIGGRNALIEAQLNFYDEAVQRSISSCQFNIFKPFRSYNIKHRVSLLFRQHLISSSGRRLSLEEDEIVNKLKIPLQSLESLDNSHLVRSVKRSNGKYYEISHDVLVEPILSRGKIYKRAKSYFAIISGSLGIALSFMFLMIAIILVFYTLFDRPLYSKDNLDIVGVIGLSVIVFLYYIWSIVLFKGGKLMVKEGRSTLKLFKTVEKEAKEFNFPYKNLGRFVKKNHK